MDQFSNDETSEKEIIKVVIVNEDGTESVVDPSTLNCLKLEITNNSDDEYMELEEDDEYSNDGNDKATDSLLLNNIKVELIEDPEEEFRGFLVDDDQSETGENEPKKPRNNTERNRRKFHTCEICGYKSFQKSHYRRHLTIHSKPLGIQCSICRKHMIAKAELTDHMEEHRCISDRDRFQCHLCSYSSKKLTNVSQHTEVHFKPEKIKFTCETCDFFTTNRTLYKKHVNMHKSSRATPKCPVCLIPFKTLALRRKHIQKYRSVDDPSKFQCPECPYNTAKFNNFKQHMVVHRNDYEIEMFLCQYCPFKSKRKTDLRQHVIVKHKTNEEVMMFRCDFCSYETRRGNHLSSHMKNRHSRDIVVKKCVLCSYKTVSQVLIEKHCNIHSKVPEQFFLCSICGSGFLTSQLLESHMYNCNSNDTDDPDEEPFENNEYVFKNKEKDSVDDNGYSIEFFTVDVEVDSAVIREERTVFCCQFPQCNYQTDCEKDAKIHKTISHNKRGDDNRCPDCTFHTTSRYLYLDHLKVHKINIEHLKPHLCDICGTRWIRQGDLTRHMSVHWGSDAERRKRISDRPQNAVQSQKELLECPVCNYTTRLRLCMFKHLEKHGGDYQQNFVMESIEIEENCDDIVKQEVIEDYYDEDGIFEIFQDQTSNSWEF